MSVQTIHFLRPPPPKKSTHQHFLSAKNPHENNNKNEAKKLKVYGIFLIFPGPPPPRKCMVLYTRENIDIYGRPLKQFQKYPDIQM